MMRAMRASAKWIMLFLALAFVGWMVFDVGMDVSGQGGATLTDAAARVNGTKIDLQTYYNALRIAQDQRRQQGLGFGTTLEEQRAFEDAVLENLIQQILLEQEYRRRGIRVSDEEIISMAQTSPPPELLQEPQFQTDGVFDQEKYRRFVASGVDPTFTLALEARYREEIPRIKLYEQLTTDVYLTDSELWQIYQDGNDSVTINLIELIPDAMVADSAISLTDEELQEYYRANRDDFTRPQTAFMSYLTTSKLMNSADTAAAFARAATLRQEILDGQDFATVAAQESADSTSRAQGGDLGVFARGGLITEFEEAVLALGDGEISEPVQTAFGLHVIKRERVTADSVHAHHILVPFELAGEHLDEVEARADTMDLFAAEADDPAALDDVADMLSIPVLAAPPVLDGNRMVIAGRVVPDAGLWAFEAIPGEISLVVETTSDFYIFRLDSIRPEGVPPFAEVQAEVRAAAVVARKWEMAAAQADEIAADLRSGTHLAEAALQRLLTFRTFGPMTRLNPSLEIAALPEVVGMAFGLGVDESSPPIRTDLAIYFVEPTAKFLADSSAFASEVEILRLQVMDEARDQRVRRFMASLRNGADVVDRRRELERTQRDFDRSNPPGSFNPLGL